MDELTKRLNALYLVVDSSVADDVKAHVLEVVKERDALRAAITSWKKEEMFWQQDIAAYREALKAYADGDECNVDGAPDANNLNHDKTCRYCRAMSLLGWPGFEKLDNSQNCKSV